MKNSFSGGFDALRGAFLRAMEDSVFALQEDIPSLLIGKTDVTPFYSAIQKRIRMTNALVGRCLQESGVSQAVFCEEICCDKTQLNKVIKSVEGSNVPFPRSLPFPVMENLCNRFDLNMSQLFLGKKMKIALPRRYQMVLEKLSSFDDREQAFFVERFQDMAAEYLSEPNLMTQCDYEKITIEDYRLFIGSRCRMYTDEKNLPPAYLIESGSVRRKATNLFEALNEDEPVFLGRISILFAVCYSANLPLEYFLIRDLSQPRLVKDIACFKKKKPTSQQLEMLRLLCSTELNHDLQCEIISDLMVQNHNKVQLMV